MLLTWFQPAAGVFVLLCVVVLVVIVKTSVVVPREAVRWAAVCLLRHVQGVTCNDCVEEEQPLDGLLWFGNAL